MASKLLVWDYCHKCGRKIFVGEDCYHIGMDSYCADCCKHVNTMHEWKRSVEAMEGEE